MVVPNPFIYLRYTITHEKRKKNIVVICGSDRETENYYHDCKAFLDDDANINFFPDWGILPYEHISPFTDLMHQRISVLYKLKNNEHGLYFIPIKAFIRYIIPPEIFTKEHIHLKINDDTDYDKFQRRLNELGYERVDRVIEPGDYCVKGGILDVFPSSLEDPIRIEFFGDTVDSIRSFDTQTQKSIDTLKEIEILPQRELFLLDDYLLAAANFIEENIDDKFKDKQQLIEKLLSKKYFQGIEQYQSFFYDKALFQDYLSEDTLFILDEAENLIKLGRTAIHEYEVSYTDSHRKNYIKASPADILTDPAREFEKLNNFINLNYLTSNQESDNNLYFESHTPHSFHGDFVQVKNLIKDYWEENKITIISSSYEMQSRRLERAFEEFKPLKDYSDITEENNNYDEILSLKSGKLYLTIADLSTGFDLPNVSLITDREIFSRKKQFLKKMRKVKSSPIESFVDLNEGDLVVHVQHGIGKFIGIERIEISGKAKDYILIIYQDNEKLYVPIEQMNLVQKYIGGDPEKTKLDNLGGKSWERTKAKAVKRAQELASELIEIYALRQKLNGIAFGKDTIWQHDFEAQFPYEETEDQLTVIEEIKQDMESARPMDRLLCGDVGYGKTEVAMRACFKAVMDGKQVAVLVPTTILCEQHYLTFKERFKEFPIRIEMISRFRKNRNIKESLKRLDIGGADIAIGTHRLISKDVNFKNLGLLLIDEEQRFGVKHKERLKQLRTLIDVLSMSATPIPRTLHMSLINIRDISTINTPPENRLPIETYTLRV